MPLVPCEWNVVVMGRWNRAILTPQGIATRLFQLPLNTSIGVEVPMDGIGPYRVSHDRLVVMVSEAWLIVEGVLPVRLHESSWLICYCGGPGIGGPRWVQMRVERCRRI